MSDNDLVLVKTDPVDSVEPISDSLEMTEEEIVNTEISEDEICDEKISDEDIADGNAAIKKNRIVFDMNYLYIALMFLTSLVVCVVFPWAVKRIGDLTSDGLFEHYFNSFANISDVRHYINIAENAYQTTGDARLSLVFFPFYPMMIRLVHIMTGLEYYVSASVVSLVSALGATFMLYKLAMLDYGKKVAYDVSRFFLIFPFTFFIFTRMSEALYLCLLFSCVYCLRKKFYICAGLLGYMTALTRLPGLLTGVIMLVEFFYDVAADVKNKTFKLTNYIKQLVMMVLTAMGFVTYLIINYVLYKTPFKFLEYQREHWSQTFTNPYYVVKDVLINAQLKGGFDLNIKIGCGLAGLIAVGLIVACILASLFLNVRASYIIYTLMYFIACYSASWLLSGGRYSLGAFPMFLVTGLLVNKIKWLRMPLMLVSTTSMLLFVYVCCLGGMY